jgi:hypothetical protein
VVAGGPRVSSGSRGQLFEGKNLEETHSPGEDPVEEEGLF